MLYCCCIVPGGPYQEVCDLTCLITGNVNRDHLVKVESARFLHYKATSPETLRPLGSSSPYEGSHVIKAYVKSMCFSLVNLFFVTEPQKTAQDGQGKNSSFLQNPALTGVRSSSSDLKVHATSTPTSASFRS